MSIMIIGCGRFGARLATLLSKAGRNVVVVDRDKDAFGLLTAEFSGFQVAGDAVDQEVLRAAKISEAEVVAAVTDDDNTNIMVAQVAKELYGVKTVLARVSDPFKGEIYEGLGLRILSPAKIFADAFAGEILMKEK